MRSHFLCVCVIPVLFDHHSFAQVKLSSHPLISVSQWPRHMKGKGNMFNALINFGKWRKKAGENIALSIVVAMLMINACDRKSTLHFSTQRGFLLETLGASPPLPSLFVPTILMGIQRYACPLDQNRLRLTDEPLQYPAKSPPRRNKFHLVSVRTFMIV